ncbi:MAG: phosphatase PAP2 family protein [Nitrospirae bacterium]|nr:phosphatase PAP2 family protein [Nitrospirota bacterium]
MDHLESDLRGLKISIGFIILFLLLPGPFSTALAGDANRSKSYAQTETVAAGPEPSTVNAAPSRTNRISGGCLFCPDYGKLLLKDARHVLSAPLRWEESDWRRFAFGTLAVLGAAAVLDRPVRDEIQRTRNGATDRVANIFEPLGSYYSIGVLGGFYLAGAAMNDPWAKYVAQDGVAASLIASGIITPVLKLSVGRSRPSQDEGSRTFRPFSGNESFPSGHTTQAFAVASVIAAYYDPLWVQTTAYGVAALVGFARIDHDAHFTSDVVAGALIGSAVGNAVVHFNERKRNRIRIYSLLDRDVRGMRIAFTY